ncbi:MAG: hypothetical protein HYV29_04130 [Ignavibacteriales bacterium]|nr:hypothetical protein [Ignavibacteriales bacterium]
MNTPRNRFFVLLLMLTSLSVSMSLAGTKEKKSPVFKKTAAVFQQRLSQASNNEFYLTNYGMYGHNVESGGAGWYWPRQSARAYIYGQSIWFGTKKKVGSDTLKLVSVGYNPNSGAGWFAPGSVDDGLATLEESDPRAAKYYMYMGIDFSSKGKNVKDPSLADWPVRWKDLTRQPGKNGYFGEYISDPAERNSYQPVFISQEDMFCIYKDTDVKRNPEYKPGLGYPIGLEFQQTVYSWGFGPYKDFVFFVYNVINKSGDTLRECYLAPAGDSDIGNATNDHNAFYSRADSLNLAFQFTENETGYSGVLGFDFLESPIVKTAADSLLIFQKTGVTRRVGEQIGLTTFRNWVIENDPPNGPARYDFMAAGVRDGDNGPGDKRLLMATGPFTMAPFDTARVVVCALIAPGRGNPITGDVQTNGYLDSLISLDIFAQGVYDNNFNAPKPPDAANAKAYGINRGVVVTWDSTAEASVDTLSGGADFLGYRVYRSRTQGGPWKLLIDIPKNSATFARQYIDVGADTSTGLINNVDYYYYVSTYDEGDVVQNIPALETPSVPNVNTVKVQPLGAIGGPPVSANPFTTSDNLGSIKNVRIQVTDQQRMNQLLAGHPLVITANPVNTGTAPNNTYTINFTIKDTVGRYSTTYTFAPGLEVNPKEGFFFNDSSIVGVTRSPEYFYSFKLVFDYSFVQRKYPFRYDTATITIGDANVALMRLGSTKTNIDSVAPLAINSSINLGEATFAINFTPGGVERIKTGTAATDSQDVPYLNMRITNTTTGEIWTPDSGSGEAPYGKFFVNTLVYKSTNGVRSSVVERKWSNRYYLTKVYPNNIDTSFFAHKLNINGQTIAFDPYSTSGFVKSFITTSYSWQRVPIRPTVVDFEVGDQVTARFVGGIAGTNNASALPSPGAKLQSTFTSGQITKYTKEILDQVKIVPNPYIISHISQVTTDVPKLYFNHLPPSCKIRIFNVAGDLIRTIDHNNGTSQEVWDLLSDGRQKVASQLLIAHIEAPDGTSTLKKFAVIVGGFRTIAD